MERAGGWIILIGLTVLGVGWGVATAGPESAADPGPPPFSCPSNVCQTATGPFRMRFGDKAHLLIQNHSDQPFFAVGVFVDATSGDLFPETRSRGPLGQIVDPGQLAAFEFVCPTDPTADVIVGLRFSFVHAPRTGGVGARVGITDGTSNTILFSEQLPRPGHVSAQEWSRASTDWQPAAINWGVPSPPAPFGGTKPQR